jgi:hypothetical protein
MPVKQMVVSAIADGQNAIAAAIAVGVVFAVVVSRSL